MRLRKIVVNPRALSILKCLVVSLKVLWLFIRLFDLVQNGARLRTMMLALLLISVLCGLLLLRTVSICLLVSLSDLQFANCAGDSEVVILVGIRMLLLNRSVVWVCVCRMLTDPLKFLRLMVRLCLCVTLVARLIGNLQALQRWNVLLLVTAFRVCVVILLNICTFRLRALVKCLLLVPSVDLTAWCLCMSLGQVLFTLLTSGLSTWRKKGLCAFST